MFENPRRGRQARSFTTNVSKILDLKSSSEQIFFRKLSLSAPVGFRNLVSPHTNTYILKVTQPFRVWATCGLTCGVVVLPSKHVVSYRFPLALLVLVSGWTKKT